MKKLAGWIVAAIVFFAVLVAAEILKEKLGMSREQKAKRQDQIERQRLGYPL